MLPMTDLKARPQGWVPDVSTFGARLALVRQAMGWTNIKEAALACSIAPQTWRNWEAGRFEPRGLVNASMKIAGVTGVDYRWLAVGPDDRPAEVPATPARATGRYLSREHVVAVGAGEPSHTASNMCSNLRTRPIDGIRPDRVSVR